MDLPPDALVKRVTDRGLRWLTFSYTEPVAYYEYALDAARLAKQAGLRVAVVTGGYISRKPLDELMKYADAFSVTLKGYTDAFYREIVGCPLEAVWDTIRALAGSKKWIEVVNLIVPTLNDKDEGLRAIARSMAKLNPQIPLHSCGSPRPGSSRTCRRRRWRRWSGRGKWRGPRASSTSTWPTCPRTRVRTRIAAVAASWWSSGSASGLAQRCAQRALPGMPFGHPGGVGLSRPLAKARPYRSAHVGLDLGRAGSGRNSVLARALRASLRVA